MTEDYGKANKMLYDETANQYRDACQKSAYPEIRRWKKELKERMKLLDTRFKNLGEP